AGSQLDERLVLDDDGNVCIAEDYDGDIAAGMARYEEALGMGTPRPRRSVVEEGKPPFVPDFARWVAEERRRAEEEGREKDGDDAGSGVPLVVAGTEAPANEQNENEDSSDETEEVAEEKCDRVSGGASETRANGESVPLMAVAEGERANLQNETG